MYTPAEAGLTTAVPAHGSALASADTCATAPALSGYSYCDIARLVNSKKTCEWRSTCRTSGAEHGGRMAEAAGAS